MIMEQIENLQKQIHDIKSVDEFDKTKKLIHEMQSIRNAKRIELEKIERTFKNTLKFIHTHVKQFRAELDITMSSGSLSSKQKMILTRRNSMSNVVPDIAIPAISVPDETFIPNYNMYYIQNTNEFAIKISGTLLSGNVGDILSKKSTSYSKRIDCSKDHSIFELKKCKLHHSNEYPTWTNSEFVYASTPYNIKNKKMRHIGSKRNKLKYDILHAHSDEIQTREKQMMHDLLIQLCVYKIHPKS
jgi:hypothetical protein